MEMDVFEGWQSDPDDFAARLAAYGTREQAIAEDEGIGFDYGTFDSPYSIDPTATTQPVYSKAKWGYNLEGDLVIIEPSRIIGHEPISSPIPRGPGQAQLDVEAGILPDEFALGSIGPAATGGGYADIWQQGLLGEKRHLPFDTDPRTFTVDAPAPDIIGFDPGMIASELGQRRELDFTDTYVPSLAETDAYGASIQPERDFAERASAIAPFMDFTETPERGVMERMADIIPFYDPQPVQAAAPAPIFESPEGWGGTVYEDPEVMPGRWYDEGAEGVRTRDRMALVGESGPELALFPNGTEIIPLDRKMKPAQAKRLRRRGEFAKAIDSFQFGGFVGDMGPEVTDLPPGAQVMPAGVSEMMTGRPTRAPRSLFRQAGMRAPSAQTISNLLPEEIEVYQEMGRLAGIPEKAFEREFRSMVPMGQGGTQQARFAPRRAGRTRYGSI
jgi:hypothetical protein